MGWNVMGFVYLIVGVVGLALAIGFIRRLLVPADQDRSQVNTSA